QARARAVLALEGEWHDLVARRWTAPAGAGRPAVAFREQSADLQRRLLEALDEFTSAEEALLRERREQTAAQSRRSRVVVPAAIARPFALPGLLTWRSAGAVTRPVRRLRQAADRLLAGEFRSVAPDGPAELAELTVRFNHMAMTLAERARALQGQEER